MIAGPLCNCGLPHLVCKPSATYPAARTNSAWLACDSAARRRDEAANHVRRFYQWCIFGALGGWSLLCVTNNGLTTANDDGTRH